MSDHFAKSIAELQDRLQKQLAEVAKTKQAINLLSDLAGQAPPFVDIDAALEANGKPAIAITFKPDEFFNKPLASSAKRVLDQRKASSQGPAELIEIFRSLKEGGFAFESRDDEVAMRGLAVSIGKNSAMFVKLPNGKIGLTEWYPATSRQRKKPKNQSPAVDVPVAPDVDDEENGGL